MAMLSNIDLIRRIALFSKLNSHQAQALAGAVSKRRVRRGEVLVEQGQVADTLFIILTGRARVLMTDPKGRQVILATLGPSDHFGEMGLIDGEPAFASVQAEVAEQGFIQVISEGVVQVHERRLTSR